MIRHALLAFALIAAASAPAQRVDVALSNFKFTPSAIHLHHGQQYVLHLTSTGGHAFAARAFFAAATVAEADRGKIRDGKIELNGSSAVDIHLTAPKPGSYPVVCTHFLHASFGMKGTITVD